MVLLLLVALMSMMMIVMAVITHSQGSNDSTNNHQGLLLANELVAEKKHDHNHDHNHGGHGISFDNEDAVVDYVKPKKREGSGCMFCDLNQEQPILHEHKNFLHTFDDDDEKTEDAAVVTPMTFTYTYELYDGQSIFTDMRHEKVPNLDFDYAILSLNDVRNINVETNEHVSLDEVYFHHLLFIPLQMLGAEALMGSTPSNPSTKFPNGYGMHMIKEKTPAININAHLLSNKNLEPIDGSIALAHKQCNECYYGPNKGSDCTPEVSGSFKCCGDSKACETATSDDYCHCTIKNDESGSGTKKTKTKYRIEVDLNISREIDKFKRIDMWTLSAPACHVNQKGVSVFEKLTPDGYCYNNTGSFNGGGSLYHKIDLQDDDSSNPLVETKINIIAPASGLIVYGVGHLHTGGVSATLRINGKEICTTGTTYGTNSNETTNARNEQNHLIAIDSCYDTPIYKDGGIRFKEGDVITAESIYNGSSNDDRFVGHGAAGEHKNVMSFFTIGVIFDGNSEWLTEKRNTRTLFNNFFHSVGL